MLCLLKIVKRVESVWIHPHRRSLLLTTLKRNNFICSRQQFPFYERNCHYARELFFFASPLNVGKNFAHTRVDPIWNGFPIEGAKQSQKLSPFVSMAKQHGSVLIHFQNLLKVVLSVHGFPFFL